GKIYEGTVRWEPASAGIRGGIVIDTNTVGGAGDAAGEKLGTVQHLRFDLASIAYAQLHNPRLNAQALGLVGSLAVRPIGRVAKPVAASFSQGVYHFQGTGTDVSGAADNFTLYSQPLYGDGEVVARIDEIGPGSVRTGVMIRAGEEQGARHAALVVDSAGELSFRFRMGDGQPTTINSGGKVTLPLYVRVSRRGTQFYGHKSLDGKNWNLVSRVYADPPTPRPSPRAGVPFVPPSGQPLARPDQEPGGAGGKPKGIAMTPLTMAGILFAGGSAEPGGTAVVQQYSGREYRTTRALDPAVPPEAQFVMAPPEYTLRGVLLRTGTFLAMNDPPRFADDRLVGKIWNKPLAVNRAELSRVQFEKLTAGSLARIPEGQTGVLLNSGDFMDGQIIQLDPTTVSVSNVTLGISSVRLGKETNILILRPVDAATAALRVGLVDGSQLMVRSAQPTPAGDLQVDESTLGLMTAPGAEVSSLTAGAEHALRLTDLTPETIEAPAGGDILDISCFDAGNALWLNLHGHMATRGLVIPTGVAATYAIPADMKYFCVRMGVPERLSSAASVRFLVLAGGTEIYRSRAITGKEGPLLVALRLDKAGTLTLKTEAVGAEDASAFGVWAEPLLVKGNRALVPVQSANGQSIFTAG
ncbi:MAG: NPCBM/NEW2 domain-containing protein, partial [Phycisphaerae bacterium]